VDAAHVSMHARGCMLVFLGVAGAFRATTRNLPPSCLAYKIPAQHAVVAGVVNYKSAGPDLCLVLRVLLFINKINKTKQTPEVQQTENERAAINTEPERTRGGGGATGAWVDR
jgi:hypothetical protein